MDEFFNERKEPVDNSDPRSPAERDYSRIVHSAAFRRLQNKTQVLGLGDSDFYRTRLTHTLEVSQIGESITRRLFAKAKTDGEKSALPDEMQIRAICLAHDLGHPPFGHGGEVSLNRCLLESRNADPGFEGNGQTLRILSRLEPYHPEHGMNLTRRTLLGVLKYPARYSDVVNNKIYDDCKADTSSPVFISKVYKPPKCYLDVEESLVDWILSGELKSDRDKFVAGRKATKSDEHKRTCYKSLDTSIMEIADDISYGVHDFEDAISLKLVDQDQFRGAVSRELAEEFLKRDGELSYDELIRCLFSAETHERKHMIGKLVGYCVHSTSQMKSNTFTNPVLDYQATLSKHARELLDALMKFVVKRVIKDTNVQLLEFKGQRIITDLFNVFSTDPDRLLSPRTLKKVRGNEDLGRVICDHISGMTDAYAARQHNKLFAPGKGSIFDQI